jgi:hypothetical protein
VTYFAYFWASDWKKMISNLFYCKK